MCCMYATYEVIRSNNKEVTEQTREKVQLTHANFFTFRPENGARHIAPHVLYACHIWSDSVKSGRSRRADTAKTSMPSVKRIRQIGTYPQYDFRCLKWHSFRLQKLQISNETLQWRHNGCDSVSNHQPHDGLLNRLFRCISKKTSKLRVTVFCAGNSPGPVNSPHKQPVTRKMFPFDDVIMFMTYSIIQKTTGWHYWSIPGSSIHFVNTVRPRQNGRHFQNDIFRCIFVNENVWIAIDILLQFVPKVPINQIPGLVQIMAWHRPGDKPFSEPMMVRLLAYMRHSASMSFNETTPYVTWYMRVNTNCITGFCARNRNIICDKNQICMIAVLGVVNICLCYATNGGLVHRRIYASLGLDDFSYIGLHWLSAIG